MSHLIALRERQPAPMAVLVLRIEGICLAGARLGREAASVLRRKIAVRLRRRAPATSWRRRRRKLRRAAGPLRGRATPRMWLPSCSPLRTPFQIAGQEVAVATALGIALHLQDGAQPEALLARASALAASAHAEGRRHSAAAANDG
ncbi:MAG: hypothetical protein IPP50_02230 [Piscinibacter sp.]|nr:hypothetical protein [Piscinibacter sp.]